MNSIWYGERPHYSIQDIKDRILNADTEQDILFHLIDLFKLGDFTQKPLLFQLLNHTKNESVLNLCIRIFCSICTHDDLLDPTNLRFLESANVEVINTFASAAVTSLSVEIVPYLLALLEEWDEIDETSIILRDSIDFYTNFEEELGEDATLEDIGQYYLEYRDEHDIGMYYYNLNLVFPGDLAKELIERVLIAANTQQALELELIPSMLSIWSGEKVPGDYYTLLNENNYKSYITYVEGLSKKEWKRGTKYFYGYECG